MGTTALLLLADSRLPAGAHAHSGGIEAAIAAGRVHDGSTLAGFLRGRLATAGLVAAAVAARAARGLVQARVPYWRLDANTGPVLASCVAVVDALEEAMDARTVSPALRRASRAQGRALLRAGRRMWTIPALPTDSLHHPVALGVVAAAAGVDPRGAAEVAAYGAIAGPATAAVRLLALDPLAVHALLADLAAECDAIAGRACSTMDDPLEDVPAATAPLLDISAEQHATWEVRLFAS
jgi:urease accessory protein